MSLDTGVENADGLPVVLVFGDEGVVILGLLVPVVVRLGLEDNVQADSSKNVTNSGKKDSNVGYLSLFASYVPSRSLSFLVQTNPLPVSSSR